ncbi:hypothetical protein LTR78_002767 [Recurvomyces mirabilis]|uniref:RNA polymerase II-associated protein RBA50 n=1 Tax=Recurvomyces mirabilis TaxID=574656 RepID=A0AAE1C3W4_9PEZI|nr:hypothetical protein LTR78_002767 [Recurvomyces mirabilis]KAK5159499.1 hypothetical protein LTS14_002641 [Recurvomyces mirabilis]
MIKGQRFELDLGSDDEEPVAKQTALPGAFVADVLERQPGSAKPPSAPTLKSKTGFPEHKKRTAQSRFKTRNDVGPKTADSARPDVSRPQAQIAPQHSSSNGGPKSWMEQEKRRIDDENNAKLAAMSPTELDEERQELMSSLSPALIERLLKRSNISSGSNETDLSAEPVAVPEPRDAHKVSSRRTVTFAEDDADPSTAEEVDDGHTEVSAPEHLPHDSVHFPRPPQPPELDPSSATFFKDLHEKYFPSLPSDPDKLEWMQSSASNNKSYDPTSTTFSAKNIRFSFTGELLAPTTAAAIPVTAGLHHHGDAPDAAGYTIAELAHLSRSSYAAQRCIAFQTLGRLLYRLGKGEFGNPGEPGADLTGIEDSLGELARGLWHEVEKQKVIETLVMESEGQGVDRGRHVSAKAYATEAVHLWQKGGGRRWKAA